MSKKTMFTIVGVLGLLSAVLAGPAAAAAPVDQSPQALMGYGLGATFTGDVMSPQFAQASCLTDPAGDVARVTNDQIAEDEPRADILTFCPEVGASDVTLSLTVAEPTDPATDPNWRGSSLTWLLDTDNDGEGEFSASMTIPETTPQARVTDLASGEEADCDVAFAFTDDALVLTFATSCIDSPRTLSVAPGIVYDQRVTNTLGQAVIDIAPNQGFAGAAFDSNRIDGDTRIETAVAASSRFADGSRSTVLLARSDNFADAQTGTPVAIANDAPILLTQTASLHPATQAEIQRVLAAGGTVIILGGPLAISPDTEEEVRQLGYDVTRYAGSNRFATAVDIATNALNNPGQLLLADGGDFTTSILAGTASATFDAAAVLLSDGDTLPPETTAYLASNTAPVTAIGDNAAAALPTATAITASGDAADLSVAVASALYTNPARAGLATMADFPDALVAGSYLADYGPAPLLFVEIDSLPTSVSNYLSATDTINSVTVFGGPDAVSQDVFDEADAAASS